MLVMLSQKVDDAAASAEERAPTSLKLPFPTY
jgi:hypothetical protein